MCNLSDIFGAARLSLRQKGVKSEVVCLLLQLN